MAIGNGVIDKNLHIRSQTVMKKIGMHRDPKDDFDHPKLPEWHPLRRHVLYRLKAEEWP